MKFGVFYQMPCAADQSPAQRYQDTIAQVQLADQLGFDAAWLAELHFNPRFSVMPSPLMVGAAIAQTTRRIRIGAAVHLIPLHQPIRMAEEAATLDLLSQGRSIFGVGRGAMPTHYAGYGIDQTEGRDRFLEALELILGAWQNDNFHYQGRYFQANALNIVPRPLQQPHPPVYIAANSPDTFSIIGQLGHNILIAPTIVTTQGALTGLAEYRRQLAAHGHHPATPQVNINVPTHVAPTPAQAQAAFQTTINNYLTTLRDIGAARGASPGSQRAHALNYQTVRDEFAAIGDPQQVTEKLAIIRQRYQPHEFMCWFNIGGMIPHQEVKTSMRLFAEKVMPHFL